VKKVLLVAFITLSLFGNEILDKESVDVEKVKNLETKKSVQKWLNGGFGLKPHKVNYLLPFGYREKPYVSSLPSIEHKNIEAELQVSLRLRVAKDLLGLKESYYTAYSHQAFWQFYIDSSPFRESLYSPEVFVKFPIDDGNSPFGLRSLTFGYTHESNGQPDTDGITFESGEVLRNFSRSLNYFYTKLRVQHEALVTDFTLLAPFDDLSDNPDIMDYRGYTKIQFTYFVSEHMFSLMGRGNVANLRGALEATYSYPLLNDANFYVKIFSGYGESLIDYNNNIAKYSIGFSFSR